MLNIFGFSFTDQIARRAKILRFKRGQQGLLDELLGFQGQSEIPLRSDETELAYLDWRLNLFALVMLLALLILTWRLFGLQIIHGREYLVRSDNNRVSFQKVPAPRGVIYSAEGEILARNQPGKNAHEIIRDYPQGAVFAHVLGYTGQISASELTDPRYNSYTRDDILGRDGLELTYDQKLRGEPGQTLLEVNSQGEVVRSLAKKQPRPGSNLYLSLQAKLQKKAGEILSQALLKYQATAAVFVAQRVKDGKVVALVSLPDYDNRVFANKKDELSQLLTSGTVLFNRAVSGSYPPGSVIKPVVGLAALQEGLITEQTKISDLPQVIRVGKFEFPDWTVAWGRGAHGNLNVAEAIAKSCDIFFYKVGGGYPVGCAGQKNRCEVAGLGPEKLKIYFKLFGLGEKTGVDLPGEAAGLVPDPIWKQSVRGEPWFLGNTYHLSIGQGDLLTTPLQINNLVTAIANGGKLVQPLLVDRIGPPEKDFETGKLMAQKVAPLTQRENLVKAKYLRTIQAGMRLAVTDGIVFPLRGAGVAVAAKTGTAEFGTKNAQGEYQTHAWVTGFAPYDEPEISFTVLLESGGKSSHAAQVAREILDWYFGG